MHPGRASFEARKRSHLRMTGRERNAPNMSSGEDSLIARYFRPLATDPGAFGLVDDAAILQASGDEVVVTTERTIPRHRSQALRVNLSDLAAKGRCPRPSCWLARCALHGPLAGWHVVRVDGPSQRRRARRPLVVSDDRRCRASISKGGAVRKLAQDAAASRMLAALPRRSRNALKAVSDHASGDGRRRSGGRLAAVRIRGIRHRPRSVPLSGLSGVAGARYGRIERSFPAVTITNFMRSEAGIAAFAGQRGGRGSDRNRHRRAVGPAIARRAGQADRAKAAVLQPFLGFSGISGKTAGLDANTCRNRPFWRSAALRRRSDFGMVPPI
jgi:hypothetical protein